MSWQVKDEITEINNLRGQIEKIRDQLFINSNQANLPSSQIVGGPSGNQAPLGAGMWTGLHTFQPDNEVVITNIELFTGLPTGSWDRIHITASSMVVAQALLGSDIKWIEGALNDGQYIIIKPKSGDTITLKTGGNIYIPADLTVNDSELIICIFYEDQQSPDAEGNWVIHKQSAGGSSGYNTIQDEGVSQTQRTTMNFVGAGVTASDDFFGSKTTITIPGAAGSQSPLLVNVDADQHNIFDLSGLFFDQAITKGLIPNAGGFVLFDTDNTHGIDFIIGTGVGGLPQMGVINGEVGLNVNLDMNLNYIKFQAIGIPPPPGGLEKRFLFSDAADFDKLKARSSTAIIDLEGLVTNMGNLNNSQITQDLNFVAASFATVDYDPNNIALTATGGFATLPGNPVAFINIKVGGASFKIPYYSP